MKKGSSFLLCIAILCLASFGDSAAPIDNGTTLQLWQCDGSIRQQWILEADTTIRFKNNTNYCVDIAQYSTSAGAMTWVYSCHTSDKNPAHQNQEFVFSGKTLYNALSQHCLSGASNLFQNGTPAVMNPCVSSPQQIWTYSSTDFTLRTANGLCLDAGSVLPPPCSKGSPVANFPFCNYNLPVLQRATDIVSRLTIAEKAGLFANGAESVPRLYLPAYQWWSEGLHGIAGSPGVSFSGTTPYATSFPQVCGLGATFNDDLIHAIGSVIGLEGRAMHNAGNAGLTFWAPNINIFRDPRWGRGQETPGEDPFRTSGYVANFVSGFQGSSDPGYLMASSCCKHFDAYSLENWDGVQRYSFNAIVDERDLQDTYLPAFRSCVERGRASGIMCSYNAVNGVPSCANDLLLTHYARDTWGFEGYITSDCGAVGNVLYTHHYTSTIPQTINVVLGAGMDNDCGGMLQTYLNETLSNGSVSIALVNRALINLFSVQIRLGIFDPDDIQPYTKIPPTAVNSVTHQKLALQAARESIVLLKNENQNLPLNKTKVRSIALVGPNGDATTTMQGNYYGNAPYLISPLQGLQSYVVNTNFVAGCGIASNDTSNFARACQAATSADVTVLVMGLDQSQEAEGRDRYIISFPGVQSQFIDYISTCAQGKPVVLVVMSGGPVDLTKEQANKKIGSILWVGYPGQSGGQAIADVIFGTYNPGGRLAYTVYPQNYVNQISMFDMYMRPNQTVNSPGRTYRFYTGSPVYQFGHGLSYTNFTYEFNDNEIGSLTSGLITKSLHQNYLDNRVYSFSVKVTNIGPIAGDDVVLAFLVGPDAGQNGNPLKSLFGFTRINLLAGQSKTINFGGTASDFSVVLPDGSRTSKAGIWKIHVGDQVKEVVVQ